MATRQLKASMLAPLREPGTIDLRLDVVDELVQSEDRLATIDKAIRTLGKVDYDKLVSTLITTRSGRSTLARDPAADAEGKIGQLLSLRTFVKTLPTIAASIQDANAHLIRRAHEFLTDPRPAQLRRRIEDTLNKEATQTTQKGALAARSARAYAIKSEINPLLDMARATCASARARRR